LLIAALLVALVIMTVLVVVLVLVLILALVVAAVLMVRVVGVGIVVATASTIQSVRWRTLRKANAETEPNRLP
jgi:hypothetical protein